MGSDSGVLKDIGPGPSSDKEEKADTGDRRSEDVIDTDHKAAGALRVWSSSKRTAGDADLNERGEDMPRSEKVRRTGQFTGYIAINRG